MFKLIVLVLAAILAIAAAKPGYVGTYSAYSPVASYGYAASPYYSAGYASPLAYSAYSGYGYGQAHYGYAASPYRYLY